MPMTNTKTFHTYAEVEVKAADNGGDTTVPTDIEIMQAGSWDAPNHGKMNIDEARLDQFVDNFNKKVRKGVPIDMEHKTDDGAVGWVNGLTRAGNSLRASVEWTKHGAQLLADKTFKYFSPEFVLDGYKDPEGKLDVSGNVLIGGALTNRPLFKNLQPIVASDSGHVGNSGKNIIFAEEGANMQLEDIRKKPVADVSDEEKKFLTEHKDELTNAEQIAFGLVEAQVAPEAGKGEAAGKKDGEGEQPVTPPIEAAAPVAASEKGKEGEQVTVSASELEALKKGAELGKMAHAELEHKKASDLVQGLIFNDHKFKPAGKDPITNFYLTLNEDQRAAFDKDVVGNIQASDSALGGEDGHTDEGELSNAAAQLDKKAEEIQASEKIPYSAALKKAREANPALAKQYEKELKPELATAEVN